MRASTARLLITGLFVYLGYTIVVLILAGLVVWMKWMLSGL